MSHSEQAPDPHHPPQHQRHPEHRRGYRVAAVELSGRYLQPIYSPRGDIEGLLLSIGDEPVQIALNPDRNNLPLMALRPGQQLVLEAVLAAPSPRGTATHVVYNLNSVKSVDGQLPGEPPQEFQGRVARLNYARHGEPNGVVLDTGDFIHLRPEGFVAAGLAVGDTVQANGRSRTMASGGHVVEASTVNGIKVPAKKRKPRKTPVT